MQYRKSVVFPLPIILKGSLLHGGRTRSCVVPYARYCAAKTSHTGTKPRLITQMENVCGVVSGGMRIVVCGNYTFSVIPHNDTSYSVGVRTAGDGMSLDIYMMGSRIANRPKGNLCMYVGESFGYAVWRYISGSSGNNYTEPESYRVVHIRVPYYVILVCALGGGLCYVMYTF